MQAAHELSPQDAFSEGADLWLMAEPEQSVFGARVDWLIQFQISRMRLHQPQSLSQKLEQLLHENELEAPKISLASASSAPLLLEVSRFLPTRALLCVPIAGAPESWSGRCRDIVEKLQAKKIRIFAPAMVKQMQLAEIHSDIQLVLQEKLKA